MSPDDPRSSTTALPSRSRSAARGRGAPPGGLVAGAAVICSLAGLVLWLHLLSGPVRLGTGLIDASRHLEKAEKRLSAGDTKAAQFEALAGSAGVERARDALASTAPMLDALGAVPVIGPALEEVDHLVAAAGHSATAARGSVDIAANALEGPNSVIERVKGKDARVKIERIEEIGEEINVLQEEVAAAKKELAAINLDNLPKRAGPRIDKAMRQADKAQATLVDADDAFEILPGVLGAQDPRTYLLGFQNTAEARGTGGAILQFRLMDVDNGRFDLRDAGSGSIYDIDENRQQLDIPLPDDAWYQAGIPDTRRFGNANWSPDFPLSTELLISYAAASDPGFPQIDGVIAVDPKVIEELIPAVGPIKIKDDDSDEVLKLGARDVVSYVLNDQYARFPFPKKRRAHLAKLVSDFYTDIFDPKSPTKLLEGLSDSLSAKRMQIWMRDNEEQAFIKDMGWDGALAKKEKSDYLLAIEQNVGGNKLDFFDAQEDKVEIRVDGDDVVTSAEFAITNRVLLPQARWVMGDSGGPLSPPVHRPMLVLYTRPDSELIEASVEGTRVDTPEPAVWGAGPPSYLERGKKAWPVTMEAMPGETVTAHFDYRVPGIVRTTKGRKVYRLVVQHQPKVRPEWMEIDLRLPDDARDIQAEGWKRDDGRMVWRGQLKEDMILEVSWRD